MYLDTPPSMFILGKKCVYKVVTSNQVKLKTKQNKQKN